MKQIDGTFKGVRDMTIYHQAWLPDGEVKAVLLVAHGLGEHSGRYMNVVHHFTPLGYAVHALDHIGHGKSEGEREMVERFSDFTETLLTFTHLVKGWQVGKPVFLLGHSMGGAIAADMLLEHQNEYKGAVLSAPAVKIGDSVSALTITLGKVLSRVAPKMGVLALDVNALSRDPAVVSAYVNDPLVFHGKTPARLGAELLSVMQRISAQAEKISLPLLLVQGSADRLVDPGGAEMLYTRASSTDKTHRVYEGFYHELFNEPERERVLKDVETWLTAHL